MAIGAVGCSLISTSDLTGPPACSGDTCVSVVDASVVEASVPTSDACAADVQTDNANCGTCGHACGSDQTCSKGACVPGCPGNIIYVAGLTGGNDNNDGCTTATAKKTIGNALSFAKSTALTTQEIHVCSGTYTEDEVVVDFPVKLLGGWDCLLWVQVGTYGYPTFNPRALTTIQPAASNLTGETMAISGLGPTGVATVDGFTIVGPEATISATTSAGIFIFGGGMPIVSNNIIEGAAASNSRSIGVLVSVGSDPEIFHNSIKGGGGELGSTGIMVNGGGLARIHDNIINGGSSMYSTATGIEIVGCTGFVGDHAIHNNDINAGNGTYDGTNITDIGVNLTRSTAEVLQNVINGGSGTGVQSTGSTTTVAMFLSGTTFGTVAGNIIEAGADQGGAHQSVDGVLVSAGASAWVVNNAVHALDLQSSTESAFAVVTEQATQVILEQNTLYGSTAALLFNGASRISATNNLLLGESSAGSVGLLFQGCEATGAPTLSFVDNAFVGFGATLAQTSLMPASDCTSTSLASVSAIEASTDFTASGNRRVVSDCTGEDASRCFVASACPNDATSGPACIETVLASWDTPTQGGADLLDDTRTWKLAPKAPCIVTQGGGSILADVADAGSSQTGVDIVPVMRTPPTSLGAYESDVGCSN